MSLYLGITSGKGGTGKSTVSCGLASAFAALGKRVLVVDLDEGLRSVDMMLGIEQDIVFDLNDFFGGAALENVIYRHPEIQNIYIIPAPDKTGSLNFDGLFALKSVLKDKFDVVIFDFAAGADLSLYEALGNDMQYIAVCNLDPISVKDAAIISENLPKTKYEPRVIINRFNIEYIKDKVFGNIDSVIDNSKLRLLGVVAGSMELSMLSVYHKIPKKSNAYKSFMRIAKRLSGEEVKLPKPKKI